MQTLDKTDLEKKKTPRPTAEERAAMLADMKEEFDEMAADSKKADLEKPDKEFWNKIA